MTSLSPSSKPARRLPAPVQIGLLAIVAVVLGLLLVAAPSALRAAASHPAPEPAPPPPGSFQATPEQWRALTFAPVRTLDFADQVSTDGKIATDDDHTVQITPPFSGRVTAVEVRAGQRVARGQVLATAQANEVAQARSDLTGADAALATARAQLQVASANATRQQALFRINGAAQRDVQQAASDLANAQNTVRSDEAALQLVRDRLSVLQSRPGSGGLAVVRAPIAGVVTLRQIGPGQYLNATSNGATNPIFAVSDLSKVWLVANVREEDADQMHMGAPVQVHVSGLPGRTFNAHIDYIAPTLDPTTRRLSVRATLDNAQGLLRPEMFADFTLQEGPAQQALGVPTSAVIYEGDTARVWVAGGDHALALRQIRTGRTEGGEVEVLSGLSPGDRVVTSGAIFIDRAAQGA